MAVIPENMTCLSSPCWSCTRSARVTMMDVSTYHLPQTQRRSRTNAHRFGFKEYRQKIPVSDQDTHVVDRTLQRIERKTVWDIRDSFIYEEILWHREEKEKWLMSVAELMLAQKSKPCTWVTFLSLWHLTTRQFEKWLKSSSMRGNVGTNTSET